MGIKFVLFDLDGTLLPMNQEEFTEGYFKLLQEKLLPRGYEPQKLIRTIWAGTAAMVGNDGQRTNEQVFWEMFCGVYGEKAAADRALFEEFYEKDFEGARVFCRQNEEAVRVLREIKAMGLRTVLATNPIFPEAATKKRIRWAGLSPSDFELVTTYENSRFCKPNPAYYREILGQIGADAGECLMVGNDVEEDMAAGEVGLSVFLLTDCLINRAGKDLAGYRSGCFGELLAYVRGLA